MPYYRRNIYVLSAVIFLAAVSWNQVVPFLPLFLRDMGVRRNLLQWVGVVFAAQSAASIIAMPFWGKMGDRYGRKPMVIRAGLCLAGIYFGMSLCRQPWQLALFRFLNGALTGFIPGSIILIATNTPGSRAPRHVATAQAASAAGLIVGPAVGEWLARAAGGYRASMQVSGAAVLISTFLVWRLVTEPSKVRQVEKTSLLQDFILSVRSPVLMSIMLTVMIQATFGAAISPILILHLRTMSEGLTGVVYSLPAAAFVMFARSWTRFGERRGYDRAILIGLVGGAIGALLLTTAHNVWIFALFYFIAGVFLAAISPAAAAITCTRVDESFRGRAYGMQMAASTLGALIAPLSASQIGAAWGIPAVFIFIGIVFLAGSLVFHLMVGKWSA